MIDSPVAFASSEKLFKEAREKGISKKEVEQWSHLTYTLHKPVRVNFQTRRVVVYEIDELGERLKRTFYFEELQKVIEPETFRIEKILRKKKNRDGTVSCYIKWKGYPDKFNSFVLEKDLEQL